jgi:hypothetical protein
MRIPPRLRGVTSLAPALAALALAGCNGSNAPEFDAPDKSPNRPSWMAEASAEAELGADHPLLGGRYSARTPSGFELDASSTDDLAGYKRGEDELLFQIETGIPERITAERYITDNRKMMGLTTVDYPGFQGGEIEAGAVGGMPAYRFHFTYDGAEGGTRSGFYYVLSRQAPGRHMLIRGGDAPAEALPTLEASALSIRPAG